MSDMTLVSMSLPEEEGLKALPLGPLYILRVLKRHGIKVDFRDYQFTDVETSDNINNVIQVCSNNSADIVAFSCWDNLLPHVVLAAKHIKESYPEKIIILGGLGPTGVADKLLRVFPFIDIVVRGEGEETIRELIDNGLNNNLSKIKGISYRCNSKVMRNPQRELIENLDSIDFPAYEEINLQRYDHIHITTSRGCPYNCDFCSISPFWGSKVRFRSIPNVIEELSLLRKKHGRKFVHLSDDTFPLNKKRAKLFCDEVEDLDIQWSMLARPELVNEDLIAKAYKSGCRAVFIGIESGSNNVLKDMNRRYTVEQAVKAILVSNKYMHVTCSFIWGFPTETLKDFQETLMTIAYLKENCPSISIQLHFLSPLATSTLSKTHTNLLSLEPWQNSNFVQAYPISDVLAIVRENKKVFPGFYYFQTPSFEQKFKLAQKIGLFNSMEEDG